MTGIRIHKIKMARQMPTKQMFMRTWTANYSAFEDNRHMTDALMETTSDGTNLSAQALAGVANNILVPEAKISRQAGLGGGYDTDRLVIEITLEITDSTMLTSYEVITGYTNHYGFIDALGNPLIDDDMLIFINGVSDLTRESHGMTNHWSVGNITQVLTPVVGVMGGETTIDSNLVAARPTDTISIMASNAMSGRGSRTTVSSMLLTSNDKRNTRENNVAANFLSKTMSSYRNELLDPTGSEDDAILNAAANRDIVDPATTASAFLRELRYKTGYQQERAIHWSDLRKLDPTLSKQDKRIVIIPLGRSAEDTAMAITNNSENWNSAFPETIIASQALTSIPAFMSQRCIGELDIEAHNATLTGEVIVNMHSIRGMRADIDLKDRRKTIEDAFKAAVFSQLNPPDMSGKRKTLYVRASLGMIGNAGVYIEINGAGKRFYSAGMFNDAAWSPCLAGDMGGLQGLANDLDIICATATNRALGSMADYEQVVSGTHNIRGVASVTRTVGGANQQGMIIGDGNAPLGKITGGGGLGF